MKQRYLVNVVIKVKVTKDNQPSLEAGHVSLAIKKAATTKVDHREIDPFKINAYSRPDFLSGLSNSF